METKRGCSAGAEKFLGVEIPVLDHGYIMLIDYMGGDHEIAEAARTSYQKGTKKRGDDVGLIRYLMRHHHTTPFEMAEMKWGCKMPIFVARQWIRHRTASVNEMSLRYSQAERDFYIPSPGEIRFQSVTMKQGSSEEEVPKELAEKAHDFFLNISIQGLTAYEELEQKGIARELARIGLPINLYTRWVWKNDLHNTLHFLKLRLDTHTQKEIRAYANAMAEVVKSFVPITWRAFEDYVLNSVTFSQGEMDIFQKLIAGGNLDELLAAIDNRWEREEFIKKWERFQNQI